MPAFQFHVGQHPILEVEADGGDCDWQFCIALKGRSGPPLVATLWNRGHAIMRIDISTELTRRGFEWNFPELHFAMGSWNQDPGQPSEIRFRLRMLPSACVVGCLPVIRTAVRATAEGFPILAMFVDTNGHSYAPTDARLTAFVGEHSAPMEYADGVWVARVPGLEAGDHIAVITAEGVIRASCHVDVRVTDGRFYSMPREKHWAVRDGSVMGPLTGSYQGTFFFRDAGSEDERMVKTQKDWDSWDRSVADTEHMHYWESLTLAAAEAMRRFPAGAVRWTNIFGRG